MGVSNTPLSGMAYAFSNDATSACTNEPVYAEVIEILDNANWYDGVTALAIEGGNFALPSTLATKTLVVYAIRPGDAPFIAPNADLNFTSSDATKATAGLHTGKNNARTYSNIWGFA